MPKLALVRHGQSVANLNGFIAGRTNSPLTDQGRAQARAIATLLRNVAFKKVYHSLLDRTRDTAQEIIEELKLSVVPKAYAALNERCWGIYEEKPHQTLDTPEGELIWASWHVRPEGGESRSDIYARSVGCLVSEVIPDVMNGNDVLVVGSNGSIKCLQMYLEDVPAHLVNGLSLPNCAAKVYEFDGTGPKPLSFELLHAT